VPYRVRHRNQFNAIQDEIVGKCMGQIACHASVEFFFC
jgi:hypothetical protein